MPEKHTHQYKRINLGVKKKYNVYKCQKLDCPHYISPIMIAGKLAECPRCGDEFRIEKKHIELAVPHCNNCYPGDSK
jgi:uncharacterized paraquat-inducible protein A